MIFCRITLTIWIALALGVNLGKHGQPRSDSYNFWIALVSAAIEILLLLGGGFYK